MDGLGLDRADYWRFLRKIYKMGALEAWDYIKRVGLPPSTEDIQNSLSRRN